MDEILTDELNAQLKIWNEAERELTATRKSHVKVLDKLLKTHMYLGKGIVKIQSDTMNLKCLLSYDDTLRIKKTQKGLLSWNQIKAVRRALSKETSAYQNDKISLKYLIQTIESKEKFFPDFLQERARARFEKSSKKEDVETIQDLKQQVSDLSELLKNVLLQKDAVECSLMGLQGGFVFVYVRIRTGRTRLELKLFRLKKQWISNRKMKKLVID